MLIMQPSRNAVSCQRQSKSSRQGFAGRCDIEAGQIDVVLVYKVDRLTRFPCVGVRSHLMARRRKPLSLSLPCFTSNGVFGRDR
jgi:DNA invertase Pin-like site-specific DNA recombinase